MNLPGYDAWKLATPPYFDLSEEEEKQMWEDEMRPYWDAQDYEAALQANMAPEWNPCQ